MGLGLMLLFKVCVGVEKQLQSEGTPIEIDFFSWGKRINICQLKGDIQIASEILLYFMEYIIFNGLPSYWAIHHVRIIST